jgi:hypothetical protein
MLFVTVGYRTCGADPEAAAHLHDIMDRQPAFTLGDGIEQWSTIAHAPDRCQHTRSLEHSVDYHIAQ